MTGIEEVAAISMIVGGGTQIAGTVAGGIAKANADNADAGIKRDQANELLGREAINEAVMKQQEGISELHTGGGIGSSDMGLGQVLQLRKDLALNISNSQRDANFKAAMLRKGATIDTNLANDSTTASIISGVGGAISTVGNVYNSYKPKTTSTNLPGVS